MTLLSNITLYIVPFIFLFVFGYAFLKRIPVFDTFLEGAARGAKSAFEILPALVGLLCAVSMFRASGALEFLANLFAPLLNKVGMPAETLPLALLKPVSGSGALSLVKDVFDQSGPDSFPGKVASVMLGSSETTFYTLAVYYGAVKITNSRYTLSAAIIADLVGILASVVICNLLYQ